MVASQTAVVTIVGMALVTYATRVGGFWAMNRVTITPRVEACLSTLPGALLISIIVPAVVTRGPADILAALLTAAVAWRSKNFLLSMAIGVAAVWVLRLIL